MPYRYYFSGKLLHKRRDAGKRIPARDFEALVAERAATLFDDPVEPSCGLVTARFGTELEQIGRRHACRGHETQKKE